jgi:CRISPR system Cascade subunit CasA
VNPVSGTLCWFDALLPFRTRSGKRVEATPLDVTKDADTDPIVGVIARHAYVELGFRFLMRVRAKATLEDDEEEDESGLAPIAALLPDAPTGNVVRKDHDFFIKRETVGAIGAGAILPVLYAHTVLFPPSGGGYFSLPHGIDSLKFAVTGDSLWQSITANLLDRQQGVMSPGPWPAPCDCTAFPWLDSGLATLSLKRGDPEARRTVLRSSIHPAAIPLPRRYRLCEPSERVCDLTGIRGLSFAAYERWPNGLQYEPRDWWAPFVASIEVLEWTGNKWGPRKSKAKVRVMADDDRVPAASADSDAVSTRFLKSRGPLRFDQWLELSLGNPPLPPADGGTGKPWQRVIPPPVVSAFVAREPFLAEELGRASQRSALARRTGFRLEAIGATLDRKALGGFDRGSLSLWRARDDVAASVADGIRGALSASHDVAKTLARAAIDATKTSDTSPTLCRQLQDGLLATLDTRLVEVTQQMFAAFAEVADEDLAQVKITQLRCALVRTARDEALNLFDASFPFAMIDQRAIRIVEARRKLESTLSRIVARERPHDLTVGASQTGVLEGASGRQAPLVG